MLLMFAVAAFVLSLVCLWHHLDRSPVRARIVGAVALASAVWLVIRFLRGADTLSDLFVLHEGGTAETLHALFGRGRHVGELWRDGLQSLSEGRAVTMVPLSRLNCALAGLAFIGVGAAGLLVTRSFVGAFATLVLLLGSRGFWVGAFSETPAPMLWFAVVAAAPAWSIVDDAARRPSIQRGHAALELGGRDEAVADLGDGTVAGRAAGEREGEEKRHGRGARDVAIHGAILFGDCGAAWGVNGPKLRARPERRQAAGREFTPGRRSASRGRSRSRR